MSSILRQQRIGYRERLHKGDVVYFATDEDEYGGKLDTLTVQKATVEQTHYGSNRRRYPIISLWSLYDVEPSGAWMSRGISPREVFTSAEVDRTLNREIGSITLDKRTLDEKLKDPVTNLEVAIALATATIHRMAEDGIAKPYDPEH